MFVSVVVALIATPACAAEFYIVQDVEKQTCAVTQELPNGDKHVLVGEGAYNDQLSAAGDMKRMLICNPQDAGSGAPQSPTGLKIQ
jgi:hypothetical protein